MRTDVNGKCYCCGCLPCIGTYGKIAAAEFEKQIRHGNKQRAPAIPNRPNDDTPFIMPYIEENLK